MWHGMARQAWTGPALVARIGWVWQAWIGTVRADADGIGLAGEAWMGLDGFGKD